MGLRFRLGPEEIARKLSSPRDTANEELRTSAYQEEIVDITHRKSSVNQETTTVAYERHLRSSSLTFMLKGSAFLLGVTLSYRRSTLLLDRYIYGRKSLMRQDSPFKGIPNPVCHFLEAIMSYIPIYFPQFELFKGFESFEKAVVRKYCSSRDRQESWANPEMQCGIAFAYCVSHGDKSARELAKSSVLFHRAHDIVRGLVRLPPWDGRPLWTLISAASATLLKGYEKYAPGDECHEKRQKVWEIKSKYDLPLRNAGAYNLSLQPHFCMPETRLTLILGPADDVKFQGTSRILALISQDLGLKIGVAATASDNCSAAAASTATLVPSRAASESDHTEREKTTWTTLQSNASGSTLPSHSAVGLTDTADSGRDASLLDKVLSYLGL